MHLAEPIQNHSVLEEHELSYHQRQLSNEKESQRGHEKTASPPEVEGGKGKKTALGD